MRYSLFLHSFSRVFSPASMVLVSGKWLRLLFYLIVFSPLHHALTDGARKQSQFPGQSIGDEKDSLPAPQLQKGHQIPWRSPADSGYLGGKRAQERRHARADEIGSQSPEVDELNDDGPIELLDFTTLPATSPDTLSATPSSLHTLRFRLDGDNGFGFPIPRHYSKRINSNGGSTSLFVQKHDAGIIAGHTRPATTNTSRSAKTRSSVRLSDGTHLATPAVSTAQKSATVTRGPQITDASAMYDTRTLSGVSGASGSYSQISTVNKDGLATILPVWFGTGGVAIIIVLVAGVAGSHPPPPPPGFPPLEIDAHGKAEPVNPNENENEGEGEDHHDDPENPGNDITTGRDRQSGAVSTTQALQGNDGVELTSQFPLSTTFSTLTNSLSTARFPLALSSVGAEISSSVTIRSHISTRTQTSSFPSPTSAINTNFSLIFPTDGNAPGNTVLASELLRLFGDNVYTSQNHVSGIVYWSVPLSPEQSQKFQANPLVCAFLKNSKVIIVLFMS